MARISNISIKQQPEHYTLTVRKTIDFMKEYAEFAEQALAQTDAYMEELDVFPISGPIACFHNTDLEQLDVEMGWQITRQAKNKNEIRCNQIPARRIVTSIDMGPYEEQDPTLTDILEWLDTNDLQLQGPICYCYLNDTERPATEYLTQMLLPVE